MAFGSKQKKLFGFQSKGKHFAKNKKHSLISAVMPNTRRKTRIDRRVLYAAGILVLIAIIYIGLSAENNVYTISHNNTITIGANKSIIIRASGTSSEFAVYFAGISSSSALMLFGKTPLMSSPIYESVMSTGQVINFSTYGNSTVDMQITLESSSPSKAILKFTRVPESFGLKATSLELFNQTTQKVTEPATTSPTTTKTTVLTTTIPKQTGLTSAEVMLAANETSYGILMSNLNSLYVKDKGCTAPVYNSTYYQRYGSLPSGPNAFASVHETTPYGINYTIKQAKGDNYNIEYSAQSYSSLTAGPILSLGINASSGSVLNATFKGLFAGSTYTQVDQIYVSQNSVTNYCGAYVP